MSYAKYPRQLLIDCWEYTVLCDWQKKLNQSEESYMTLVMTANYPVKIPV